DVLFSLLFLFKTQSMGPQHRTKVDVPDHVLYTVGSCVLVIGSIGITGNLLVLYAFCRKIRISNSALTCGLPVDLTSIRDCGLIGCG
ncbi:hypothetical protein JD844_026438, partial [Phrynosoma platyrhinos]